MSQLNLVERVNEGFKKVEDKLHSSSAHNLEEIQENANQYNLLIQSFQDSMTIQNAEIWDL